MTEMEIEREAEANLAFSSVYVARYQSNILFKRIFPVQLFFFSGAKSHRLLLNRPPTFVFCNSYLIRISIKGDINQSMASDGKGLAIVIMGVSGSGKSTIGEMLAEVLNCSYLDADDFHPQANKDKMSKGIPLSEEDRTPWLETLRDHIREHVTSGKILVLSCSALQSKYREVLRTSDPNYEPRSYNCRVKFVCLQAPVKVISDRLKKRAAEGRHFMPASLLQSQIGLLQIDDAEGIIMVDATLSPQSIVAGLRDFNS